MGNVPVDEIVIHGLNVTLPRKKWVESSRQIFASEGGEKGGKEQQQRRLLLLQQQIMVGRIPWPDGMIRQEKEGSGGCGGDAQGGSGQPRRQRRRYRLFLLSGLDAFMGARAARLRTIRCAVVTCSDEADFLTRLVGCGRSRTGFLNPLRLRGITRYLVDGSEWEAAEAVAAMLAGTSDRKFLALDVDEEAVRTLDDLCIALGERLSHFVLPPYIPAYISKHERDVQARVARLISDLVLARPVSDARFAWPGPEEIEIVCGSFPRYRKRAVEGAVVAIPDVGVISTSLSGKSERQRPSQHGRGGEEPAASAMDPPAYRRGVPPPAAPATMTVAATSSTTVTPGTAASRKEGAVDAVASKAAALAARKARQHITHNDIEHTLSLVRRMKNVIAIPGADGPHLPYVVDLKTKRVSTMEDRGAVTVLRDYEATMPATATTVATAAAMPVAAAVATAAKTVPGGDADDHIRRNSIFVFPSQAVAQLRLGRGLPAETCEDVRMIAFDDVSVVEGFAKEHRTARGVIFYR